MVVPKRERFTLSAIGATLAIASPLANAIDAGVDAGVAAIGWGAMSILFLTWLGAVLLVTWNESTNRYECFLSGAGLPSLLVSLALGSKIVT